MTYSACVALGLEPEIEETVMGGSASGVPAVTLELYEKLVATNPSVERKGATKKRTRR